MNEELTWDNGTPFPEPCIDRIADTVGKVTIFHLMDLNVVIWNMHQVDDFFGLKLVWSIGLALRRIELFCGFGIIGCVEW